MTPYVLQTILIYTKRCLASAHNPDFGQFWGMAFNTKGINTWTCRKAHWGKKTFSMCEINKEPFPYLHQSMDHTKNPAKIPSLERSVSHTLDSFHTTAVPIVHLSTRNRSQQCLILVLDRVWKDWDWKKSVDVDTCPGNSWGDILLLWGDLLSLTVAFLRVYLFPWVRSSPN